MKNDELNNELEHEWNAIRSNIEKMYLLMRKLFDLKKIDVDTLLECEEHLEELNHKNLIIYGKLSDSLMIKNFTKRNMDSKKIRNNDNRKSEAISIDKETHKSSIDESVQLKSIDEFDLDDMKVFKTDDMQWIAAPTLLHALSLLEKQIGELDISQIQDVEEADINSEGMWDSYSISEKEKRAFENGLIEIKEAKSAKFGDYGIFASELCKFTSFEAVIKREGVGTYVIACTEY